MAIELSVDASALLAELEGLPVGQRLGHLRTLGEPGSLLIALCEETDRLAASEIARAITTSEFVLVLADELGAPRARAEARGARAMAMAYAGRLEESLADCADAVLIAESAGLTIEASRARLASVHPLARLGRYDEAVAAGETAREGLAAVGELVLAARADVSLGAVHDMREEPAEALRHYDRALTGIGDDPMVVAQIETNRGIALMGLDDFARSEVAFLTAVAAFEISGLDWAAAVAEGNLAYLATRQGRLERALHHFERARRCLEADESPADLARLLAEQADALALMGMPREALDVYERVLPKLERHGLALEAAQARAGLGRAQLRLGRMEEAGASLAMASTELVALGQDVARARLDLIRSELAVAQARPDEARVLAEDALEAFSALPSDAVVAHEHLARLDLEGSDLAAAESHLAIAMPIAELLDLAPSRARLLHLRGLTWQRRGAVNEAVHDLHEAVEQVERVRGTLQAERFRTAFHGSHLDIYEDAVLAALAVGNSSLDEAFAMVEAAKSRALLDVVGGALDLAAAAQESDRPGEATLLADLARLRNELNWQYSRVNEPAAHETSRDLQGARRAAMQRLESELDALQDRLAVARGLAGLFAPPLGLAEALLIVPAGTALIEYFAAGDEVMAFLLHDGQTTVFRQLATPGGLEERVRRVHFQIGRAVAGARRAIEGPRAERMLIDARRELGDLYDLLIAPLGSTLVAAGRLVIVPHGILHSLPFHALWNGDRYLIETHEVVTAPSASVLAQVAAVGVADKGKHSACVAGVPDAVAPWIELEANEVADLLGVPPMLGTDVTVEEFTRAAENAEIVHLACHGRFFSDRPLASGLKLADRWLTVRDVYGLRLRASLVTLSGCDTGKAAVAGSDELLGLMRGFFVAGARSLLISLWVVNDESATELMVEFYQNLQQGNRAASALRAAQRSMIARRPHPAFWAPFMLGGHP